MLKVQVYIAAFIRSDYNKRKRNISGFKKWHSVTPRNELKSFMGEKLLSIKEGRLPDIQVALRVLGTYLWLRMWSRPILNPTTLGPSSSGVMITTDTATLAKTRMITNTAMLIPFQFFWLGLAATNSWKKRRKLDCTRLRLDKKISGWSVIYWAKSVEKDFGLVWITLRFDCPQSAWKFSIKIWVYGMLEDLPT